MLKNRSAHCISPCSTGTAAVLLSTKRSQISTKTMCTVRSILLLSSCFVCLSWNCQSVISMSLDMPMPEELPVATANLNINYKSEETGSGLKYEVLTGNYAMASPIVPEYGQLVHVLTDNGANDGCLPLFKNVPKHSQGKWIALIERGNCKFHNKVINAAFIHNASAVVVYNHVEEPDLLVMKHFSKYIYYMSASDNH